LSVGPSQVSFAVTMYFHAMLTSGLSGSSPTGAGRSGGLRRAGSHAPTEEFAIG